MADQQTDIFGTITQRREFNGKYTEPIEEVSAEFTLVDHLNEIAMCSADHSDVGMKRGGATQTLELSFLDDAKDFGL
jgi:hypothetical protein